MNARQINLLLFDSIPEIRDRYEEEVSWQDGHDTGAHVVYGNVLNRFVEERILQGDLEFVKRVLAFVEVVLEMDDKDAENVIEVTFLENFYYTEEFCDLIEGELGPRALVLWRRIAEAPGAPKRKK